jgi:hypothetical protein
VAGGEAGEDPADLVGVARVVGAGLAVGLAGAAAEVGHHAVPADGGQVAHQAAGVGELLEPSSP